MTAAGTTGTICSGSSSEADRKAEAAVLEPRHHTVGGGEAVRTAAGEADGVHRRDEVLGTQRVGLPRSRSAAPHVHARCRPCRHDHRRGPGAPTAADPLVVADSDARDVRDRPPVRQSVGHGRRTR